MDRFFDILKKTLVAIVFVIFGFSVTYVPIPYEEETTTVPTVEAQIPVTDAAVLAAVVANTTIREKRELVLDNIAFTIAKSMMSQMITSTIDWINTGFEGSPAFIQDLDRYLLTVADEEAGRFIQSLGEVGSFLCSDFQLDIQVALSLYYQRVREDRPYQGCRISEVADNLEEIQNGVFEGDFWDDWLVITSNPGEYTPYGQYYTAKASLDERLAEAIAAENRQLDWGSGFLSGEICRTIEGPSGSEEECVISKPGQVIAESLNKALGAGQDQLIAADEINELISALIGGLANQAIVGTAGLLGLTANTGYASGDYDSGSYINEIRNSSTEELDSLSEGGNPIQGSIPTQEEARNLAENYLPRLNQKLQEDLEAENEQLVESAINQANDILETTTTNLPTLRTMSTDYQTLENEYVSAISDDDKRRIRAEQAQILSYFYQLNNLYTERSIENFKREWDRLLDL